MNEEELEFFEKQGFTYVNTIAKGGYGVIYYVYSKKYDSHFALKKIPQRRFNPNEINSLISIDNPLTVSLYSYYLFNGFVYLLMEFCQNDLFNVFQQHKDITELQLQRYIWGMISAIKACHDKNIAHLDIKPSNFVLDKYGRVKVCDFGLSCYFDESESSSEFKGTMLYMAPEVLDKKLFNPLKADIWSLGVSIYFLATRSYPFVAKDRFQLIQAMQKSQYAQYKIQDKNLRYMIARCLDPNPAKRPNVEELLYMEYFSNIPKGIKLQKSVGPNTRSHNDIIFKPSTKLISESILKNCANLVFKRRMSK